MSGDGQIAVAVKSSKDERYGCHWVVTHDGRCMRCYTADTLQEFKAIMGPHYQKLQVGQVEIPAPSEAFVPKWREGEHVFELVSTCVL